MKPNKTLFSLALTIVVLMGSLYLLKNFSFTWVEVQENKATVTVNFLFPMAKEKLPQCIKIQPQISRAKDFNCKIKWLSERTAQITIEEVSIIKGQKVRLIIQQAPTKRSKILKNVETTIQFKTPIHILSPQEETLVATENPFIIVFNTPMKKSMLHKYLESDANFYIEPIKTSTDTGKEIADTTTYQFLPKRKLENNKRYVLSFRKGMPSEAGVMLKENINVTLYTDTKPIITRLYPVSGSRWVGLFPRITLETDLPVVKSYIELNGQKLLGKQITEYKAEFFPLKPLEAETIYTIKTNVQAPSGEMSEVKESIFTTVPIRDDRIWVEVILESNKNRLIVYKGKKPVKTMICSGGATNSKTPLGTFYTSEKGDKYYSYKYNEGANSWIKLSEGIILQGITRDEYWQIKNKVMRDLGKAQTKGNIVLSEEDALWLCGELPDDTMVIIHQ